MKAVPIAVVALLAVLYSATGTEPISVALCSAAGMIVACFVAWLLPWSLPRVNRPLDRRVGWFVIGLCLLMQVSVATSAWPLRLAFKLSRPDLERTANGLRTGKPFGGPHMVGCFMIRSVDIDDRPGVVSLWIDLDPTGRTGLLNGRPEDMPQYPWSKFTLGDRWYLLSED